MAQLKRFFLLSGIAIVMIASSLHGKDKSLLHRVNREFNKGKANFTYWWKNFQDRDEIKTSYENSYYFTEYGMIPYTTGKHEKKIRVTKEGMKNAVLLYLRYLKDKEKETWRKPQKIWWGELLTGFGLITVTGSIYGLILTISDPNYNPIAPFLMIPSMIGFFTTLYGTRKLYRGITCEKRFKRKVSHYQDVLAEIETIENQEAEQEYIDQE